MALHINEIAPDFRQNSTQGPIHFHQWAGASWVVLFSHPKDFTPVCTTELGAVGKFSQEFARRGVKVIGLSVDPLGDHERWARDIEETQGVRPDFPILADADFSVAKLYDMLPAAISGDPSKRSPADNQTVRNVFVIDPDKKIRLVMIYPMAVGRNFPEILRAIDALQLSDAHKVATPADWKPGDDVIIQNSISDEEARSRFPRGFDKIKPYLRMTPQP
ncbi:alkyl hydroperoxide reductase subunit AhpC [Rhodoblastus acidophilus]|uniref:peroxiredoxin n=1 Tax=Rhodoblastus acidophilus TaxID=1074 RepID=UPI00222474D6|nr:peroxiredoxin [Rhodoblastus acidophilus]MCW2286014.1 alkyl hydroperoxide reductase subunit AhpC [Rhodoblastus acidophilus]MCW2334908.1 alkyl hydroperoxide reductase subunit AhpC [Rhodoblastus acidophilus]